MAKVTSKLQVTLPKAIATQYRIKPGDDILWVAAGDAIRVVPARAALRPTAPVDRLKAFDRATERQAARQAGRSPGRPARRGWRREDLYDRGRPR